MNLKETPEKIREDLKNKNPNSFPYRACKIAAITMNLNGYDIIGGAIKVENYCDMGIEKELTHYWNKNPKNGENIDITASQFNIHFLDKNKFPSIFKWKGDNPLYNSKKEGLSPGETLFG